MKNNKILGVKKDDKTILDASDKNIYLVDEEVLKVREALQALMGVNGDIFVGEIVLTQQLTQQSYDAICENIQFNGKDSIIQYFGVVYYYYLQGKK